MILHDFNRSGGGMGSSSQLGVGGGAVGGVGGAIGGSAGQQLASTNPRGYSSFTESDQDGSSAVVSLNGTQIVMNNMARSRAPLPGFSSFVWRTTSQCSLSLSTWNTMCYFVVLLWSKKSPRLCKFIKKKEEIFTHPCYSTWSMRRVTFLYLKSTYIIEIRQTVA